MLGGTFACCRAIPYERCKGRWVGVPDDAGKSGERRWGRAFLLDEVNKLENHLFLRFLKVMRDRDTAHIGVTLDSAPPHVRPIGENDEHMSRQNNDYSRHSPPLLSSPFSFPPPFLLPLPLPFPPFYRPSTTMFYKPGALTYFGFAESNTIYTDPLKPPPAPTRA